MSRLGVDVSSVITSDLLTKARAAQLDDPLFVGRYFKKPGNTDPVQYQPAKENALLHQRGLRLLCLGRQTTSVTGSYAKGKADGADNCSAVTAALGAAYLATLGFDPLIFLDVEPSHPVSTDYWRGWSEACVTGVQSGGHTIRFGPAIYINHGDGPSWTNLKHAMDAGSECLGAWVASYADRTGAEPPPAWDPDEAGAKPPSVAPCPVHLWQYAGDYLEVLDFNVVGPTQAAIDFVNRMPIPPAH